MKLETYKETCNQYAVEPFQVRVEWYTGDITIETVIADDGKFFYFVFNENKSWYAPHGFCTRTEKK